MKWQQSKRTAETFACVAKNSYTGFWCYFDYKTSKYLCCWYMDPTDINAYCFINNGGLCSKKFDIKRNNQQVPDDSFLYKTLEQAMKAANSFAKKIQFRN